MARHPRITKEEQANREWFKAEIGRRLEAVGATRSRDCDYAYEYAVATVAGNLSSRSTMIGLPADSRSRSVPRLP